MKRYKVSDNFYLDEFINPNTYNRFGLKSSRYIRKELIETAQLFRSITNSPITINNWLNGGSYSESGLRDWRTPTGAKYSMHKFGQALDIKCGGLTSFQMFDVISDNWYMFYKLGIRRVEHPNYTKGKNRGWLHIDMANDLSNLSDKPVIVVP